MERIRRKKKEIRENGIINTPLVPSGALLPLRSLAGTSEKAHSCSFLRLTQILQGWIPLQRSFLRLQLSQARATRLRLSGGTAALGILLTRTMLAVWIVGVVFVVAVVAVVVVRLVVVVVVRLAVGAAFSLLIYSGHVSDSLHRWIAGCGLDGENLMWSSWLIQGTLCAVTDSMPIRWWACTVCSKDSRVGCVKGNLVCSHVINCRTIDSCGFVLGPSWHHNLAGYLLHMVLIAEKRGRGGGRRRRESKVVSITTRP